MSSLPAMPDRVPHSAEYALADLAMFHEDIPQVVSDWGVRAPEYNALLANLPLTHTHRLSTKQHRRLSALMDIWFSVTPRPIEPHNACGAVLQHPRSAPNGDGRALDVMCASLEGLEAVAEYFQSLSHGPCLLPGMLQDLLLTSEPCPRWYRELLEEAERMCTWELAGPEGRALADGLGATLRAEALCAPQAIRATILRDALQSTCPSISAWGEQWLTVLDAGAAP